MTGTLLSGRFPWYEIVQGTELQQGDLLEYSANLRTWKSFTNFVSTTAVTVFNEVTPLPSGQRFYRAFAP